jgi:predicted ATPase
VTAAISGRYEPTAIVGRGGQGYVLHAIDTRHDRPVAIKVCNAPTPTDRDMLLAEARVLLTLDPHPNLPLARDDFFLDDRYCIVMDWIEGSSLAQLLEASEGDGLPADLVVEALGQVAAALDHLHAHDPPVLHLDVKPSNILARADGRFVLVDLGLSARLISTYGAGTSDYLAPEYGAASEPTPAADVFSLAVTAFELLTGSPPAPGAAPDWGDTPVEESRRLTEVLRRGLSTDPGRRPRSAGELVELLRPRPARNNLPASLSSFVGREAEVRELTTTLATERCVTIVGTGGAGKTRVALEVARESLHAHDAVSFVELAGLQDGSLLADHVGRVLGLRERRGRDQLDAITDLLREGRQILVLDNCEHVVDACAHLAEQLLRSCPDLSVLATSREALRTTGEVVRRLPPMRLPDEQMPASESEAVRLFSVRACAADPGLRIDRDGEAVIARICAGLEGIPLAIELAAARVGEMSVDAVAAQLDDLLGTLVGGPRTTPRHETLRATLEWSYGLLADDERVVLGELSVFAGTFTSEAARAISSRDVIDPTTSALVERSLCERRERRSGERLYLLAPVRRFAAEQLDADAAEVLRTNHLVWHRELAELGRDRMRRADQSEWIDRLEDAYEDMRSALDHAHTILALDEELRLTVALSGFWGDRGYWTEGRNALERALHNRPGSELAARAHIELGSLTRMQGDDDAARSSFERALELAQSHGDELSTIAARAGLARVISDQGDHASAIAIVTELLDTARRSGAPNLVVDLLADVGTSAQYLGDLPTAKAAFAEAVEMTRSLGDLRRAADLEACRGTVAFIEGDNTTARAVFEEVRRLAMQLRDDSLLATATSHLAGCASRDGDHASACELYEESIAIFRRLGHQWRVALTLSELAQSTLQAGDFDAGRALLEESLELSIRCGFHLIQGENLHKLALLAHAQGEPAASARALADAIRICREHGDTLRVVLLVEHSAVLAAEAGRPEEAIVLAAAAEAQRERIGFPRQRMPVLERALTEGAAAVGEGARVGAEEQGHATSMSDAVTSAIELCVDLIAT